MTDSGVHGGGTFDGTFVDDILGQSSATTSDFVANSINGGTAPTLTAQYDLISNNNPSIGTGLPSGPTVLSGDPMLGALLSNGGPTPTMALMPTSPAIAAGTTPNYPGTDTPITTDQRGYPARPRPTSGPTSTPPSATATFLGDDSTTEGSWIGVYGSQGYNVINATNGVDYPSYATVTPAGNTPYTWAANTNLVQALQDPSGSGRIAACLVFRVNSFTVDVNITDGQAHNLELYLLDYDSTSRSEHIVFTDANTHAVLSTQSVSSFYTGVYLNYTISGNVLITITKTGGANAVLSGLFFDPSPPPASTTTSVSSSLNPSTTGQSVTFTATVSDTSGGVPTGSVEFYDGSTDLGPGSALSGSGNSATSTLTTSTLTAGSHSISAVYTPTGDFAGSSGSLTQTVNTSTSDRKLSRQ